MFLLGHGIQKSLSPLIQNRAFELRGLKASYSLMDIMESQFDATVRKIGNSKDILGFNLTAPFKEEIIPYLSHIDRQAESVGAVNTVKVVERNLLQGFNTDVDGVVASMSKLGLSKLQAKKHGVVLGAGGAARASVYSLALNGFESVTILNRTITRARSVARHFGRTFPRTKFKALPLEEVEFQRAIENCEFLINAISDSSRDEYPIKLDFTAAQKPMKVFDLDYKGQSIFFKHAKSMGFKSLNGLFMLVEQAARSFEIWTNLPAPRRQMLLAARQAN